MHNKPSVLLVSIDAVKPDIVFNQEKYNIKLDTINSLMKSGSYVKEGVRSVFPSFTYCCHQSIITGMYPDKHNIIGNKYFDPTGIHQDAWFWYTNTKVDNLWSAAKRNGYLSVNIGLPTSVMAETDYNIPEYWRDTTSLDSEILNAISVPRGLSKEVEEAIGKNIPCGLWDIKDDETKLETCLWILENKVKDNIKNKPFFMSTYFASYDDYAHNEGTYDEVSLSYLERTDKLLGILIEKVRDITDGNVIVCVVSDHGMLDNKGDIRPNTLFFKEGLIDLDKNNNVCDWKVFAQRMGGSAYIKLKNSDDFETKDKVEKILYKLKNDKESKVLEVLTGSEAKEKRRGMHTADYVLISEPGYEVREDVLGEYRLDSPSQKAQHGYIEEIDDMKAILFIEGPSIKSNNDLGSFNLVDIAPSLANLMGFEIRDADGIKRL